MRVWVSLILGIFSTLTVAAQPISKLVVFGDSLSDNGNSYEYSHHSKPPDVLYYHGRFSNGPIWIDYVAKTLFPNEASQHLLNYAFGGAGVLHSREQAFTLSQEVDSYLLTHQARSESHTWFVLWMGANDYLIHPDSSVTTVNSVIMEMERNLLRLMAHGAQHFMIIGLPDLGLSPFAHELELQKQLSAVSHEHNHILMARIAKLQHLHPKLDWHFVDVNQTFVSIIASPKRYGFAHTEKRCFEPGSNQTNKHPTGPNAWLQAAVTWQRAQNAKRNCGDYVFFDQFHPTTHVHQIFAQQFIKALQRQS